VIGFHSNLVRIRSNFHLHFPVYFVIPSALCLARGTCFSLAAEKKRIPPFGWNDNILVGMTIFLHYVHKCTYIWQEQQGKGASRRVGVTGVAWDAICRAGNGPGVDDRERTGFRVVVGKIARP
jgi:hypothetical protein